ncbi:MAG: hypothetical protein K0S06_3709 [Microvirga sp.]|jgi:hypothetical protein|nr:hypothetical protein [Microvirga sp.]
MRLLAPAIVFSAIAVGATAVAAAPGDFGGRWAVRMVTDSGVCEASYNYVIAVEEGGRVRYIPQDSDPAPSVSGSVGADGAVSLDIRKSIARVNATGRLKGASGSGSWRLPGLCTGRWTASKRGPVQAAR